MNAKTISRESLDRAQGCILGQLSGDSLGGLVEFRTSEEIFNLYPSGVRDLADGGTWNTIAGQPTDDSEMAIALTRTLVRDGRYDASAVRKAYEEWFYSDPFDCGMTICLGLTGTPMLSSQANGALMRVAPLGIFGAKCDPELVAKWASDDAEITHPNKTCRDANALFAIGISHAIRTGCNAVELWQEIQEWSQKLQVAPELRAIVAKPTDQSNDQFTRHRGWVLVAFQNALWQLLNASDLESGIIDTISRGGDTDTNAAICGALLGSVYGIRRVPSRWVKVILNCRPVEGSPEVLRPRPDIYWPVDAMSLAEQLLLQQTE
jgi:ADP-ribosylglycohydrolase